MKVDLNDPNDFTIENVRKLIASEDDSVNTQFRVTDAGILFLSRDVGNRNLEGVKFSIETSIAGNGYVGQGAAENENWVKRIYKVFKENYPDSEWGSYCDVF